MLSDFMYRLRAVFRRKQVEAELDDELQFHIEQQTEKHTQAGVPRAEAMRRARLELGGVDQYKEKCRDARGVSVLDTTFQDIRYAVRMLIRNRGFAVTAVLTLAIGVASATTVFTFVRAMLFQPPTGIATPDRVFAVYMRQKVFDEDYQDYRGFSYPQFEALRDVQDVFSKMVWYARREAVVSIGDYAESLSMEVISGDHFGMLGTIPALGRNIGARDDVPGGPAVAMISYELWQARYGGRTDVLSQTVSIDGQNFVIIGVTPESYVGVNLDWVQFPQVWIPLNNITILNPAATLLKTRGAWMRVIGRLKPDVAPTAAEARLTQLIPVVNDPSDKYRPDMAALAPLSHARINPRMRDTMTGFFGILMTVSILILLAACFNVGSFLIGQAATRKHEMAVRLALGASRRRVIRQLMTESTILGLSAAVAGLLLSLLLSRMTSHLPNLFSGFQLYAGPSVEPDMLVFALGLGMLTTFVFGFTPAVLVSRRDPWTVLKNPSVGWSWTGLRLSARQLVLVLQVTLAVVLAITGALYARSLYNLSRLDPGFVADRLILAQVNEVKIPTEQREHFDRELLSRLRALPGVVSASISAFPPTDGSLPRLQFRAPGIDEEPYFMAVELVGVSYFQTTGTTLTAGHEFTDTPADKASVIINEVLARKLWQDESPIGMIVETNGLARQVIGVVPLLNCWDHLGDPDPCVFVPLDTRTTKTIVLKVVAYSGMGDALRRTVHQLNPNVLVPDVKAIEEHMRGRLGVEIFATVATGVLAIIGVLLSAIGCYAVFSSMVKESTREIALRLALGAPVSRLLGRIILRSTLLCSLGIAAGAMLAVVIATQFQEQLFNVQPSDPWVLTSTAILIIAVSVIASFVPGRLIAKADPASALKII